MMDFVKDRLFFNSLKRKKAIIQRQSAFLEMDEINSIALINKGDGDAHSWAKHRNVYEKLKKSGKQVFMITYCSEKIVPEYLKELHQIIITKKDISWSGIPSKELQKEIVNQKFDIIIDLTKVSNRTTLYLLTIVRAKMRIGKNDDRSQPFFDLLIDWKEDESLNDFIDHIIYYLKILKKSTK